MERTEPESSWLGCPCLADGVVVMAEAGGVGGTAMAREVEELAAILKVLAAYYAAANRYSRDGIMRPRPGDGAEMAMAA